MKLRVAPIGVAFALLTTAVQSGEAQQAAVRAGISAEEPTIELVAEYQTPGTETELSGIYPHPTDNNLYFVVTNAKPDYQRLMKPMLPVNLRNKLLTVNKLGRVVSALDLPDGGGLFGDLAWGDGHLWLGPLDPPALWKLNLDSKQVVARYPLPGPAGGMEFDSRRSLIYVQSYVGHPHLAVVDPKTGAVTESLWSDENCQGVAVVADDLLTVWTSSWDKDAYTELWRLDRSTGRPLSRTRLDGIHAAMAPLDPRVAGFEGFMTLTHTDASVTGATTIRRYRYRRTPVQAISPPSPKPETFAAVTYEPHVGRRDENRAQLLKLVSEAAANGARYVVLPELALTGELRGDDGVRAAEDLSGVTARAFVEVARSHGVSIVFSLIEHDSERPGYYLSTVLVDSGGAVSGSVRKRLVRPTGSDGPATPGFVRHLMETIDDDGRRLGILSGDDLLSGLPRLASRGADTVLVTANWTTDEPLASRELLTRLAKQYQVNLVVANQRRAGTGIVDRTGDYTPPGVDGRATATLSTSAAHWRVQTSLGLPAVPVPSDLPFNPALVELGRRLFFDTELSVTGEVSCGSCHQPHQSFADGREKGEGIHRRRTSRNVPSLLNAAFKPTLHWDGNPTTLEQQAKYPLGGESEMGRSSRADLREFVQSRPTYVDAFREALDVEAGEIDYTHVSQALGAYQRTLVSGDSNFDRYYYGGDKTALEPAAIKGLELFVEARCSVCHTIGPRAALFADGRFHSLGVGYHSESQTFADRGIAGVSSSDYTGMFFTPSLRNVAVTAPYMHDGSAPTLTDAIAAHYKSPVPARPAVTSRLDSSQLASLIAFLGSLTGRERYSIDGERLAESGR
jgi:cytochrome c peroxidase